MAETRRLRVDGRLPASTSCARKAATVSAAAGNALTSRSWHQAWKIRKSLVYARRVDSAFSSRASSAARVRSGARAAGMAAPDEMGTRAFIADAFRDVENL